MPIYQDVTAPRDEPALGVGAATDAIGLGGATDPLVDVPDSLPEMTPEMYSQIWGQMPGGTTTTSTSGGGPWAGDSGATQPLSGKATGVAAEIIRRSKRFLGTPYVWGGTGTGGVDCSGLIQAVFQEAGIKLPRVSADQVRSGRRVAFGAVQAGDLLGWDNSSRNNGADHVALVIGRKGRRVQIIEAARPGTKVRIRWVSPNEGAWGSRVL